MTDYTKDIIPQKKSIKLPSKKILIISSAGTALVLTIVIICVLLSPFGQYKMGMSAYNKQKYESAVKHFQAAGSYRDAPARLADATLAWNYKLASDAMLTEDYATAVEKFSLIPGYLDADEKLVLAQTCYHYQQGGELFEAGDYLSAAEQFALVSDYQDAAIKETDCYYAYASATEASGDYAAAAEYYGMASDKEDSAERIYYCGRALIEAGNYSEAADVLADTDFEDAADWRWYALGWSTYESGNYSAAENYFRSSSGIEDSDSMRIDSAYHAGIDKIESGEYDDAKAYFEISSGYEDSDEMILNCRLMLAEEEYDKGNLNSARDAFLELPEDLVYNDISVSERLATLEEYSEYVDLCGRWESTSGTMTSARYMTYTSSGWTLDIEDNYYITIRCVIEDDGSITIKGSISYDVFNGYSSVRDYMIYYWDHRSYDFTIEDVSLSDTWDIRSTATLSYSNGSFHMVDFVEDTPYSGTREEYTTDIVYGDLAEYNRY